MERLRARVFLVWCLILRHYTSDEWKNLIHKDNESEWGMLMVLKEYLKAFGNVCVQGLWVIMPWVEHYHHHHGLVCVSYGTCEFGRHIIGILRPSTMDPDTLRTSKALFLDVRLLERVLMTHIFIIKSICFNFHFSYSLELKDALYKMIDELRFVDDWLWFLLLPPCTLKVVEPQNRRDRRPGIESPYNITFWGAWLLRETQIVLPIFHMLLGISRKRWFGS